MQNWRGILVLMDLYTFIVRLFIKIEGVGNLVLMVLYVSNCIVVGERWWRWQEDGTILHKMASTSKSILMFGTILKSMSFMKE